MASSNYQTEQSPIVVGVGSSAGGLEALTQLFNSVASPGRQQGFQHLAFVVLQHVSPNHKSMMADILSRETALTVTELKHGSVPKGGCVYVVPSNYNASFSEGQLILSVADPVIAPKPSINEFFISLAAENGDRSIGIVLSGTGSDGSAGLRAIQAAGGITIAQEPRSAKYPGMPLSAIESSVADFVLTPSDIAKRLLQITPEILDEPEAINDQKLNSLLDLLKSQRELDFSGYKLGTVIRRIRRRVIATGQKDLDSYLDWVHHHLSELDILTRDLLISVTAFFRDRESFNALESIAQKICANKELGEEIRIWVAGCATGEEAYSLAIIFNEALQDKASSQSIQIFATDIDEDALNVARRGIYPTAALSSITDEWKLKYFTEHDQNLEVSKRLRDMIVFARHNLVNDPPFLRLDLVTCRNVLIYFDNALQTRVLHRFHFALSDPGYLFLGRSESISQAENQFDIIDRKERIFSKVGQSNQSHSLIDNQPKRLVSTAKREDKSLMLLNAIVEHLNATLALCDRQGGVQFTAGDVSHFFRFPMGKTKMLISEIVIEPLQAEVMALLHRFKKEQTLILSHPKRLNEALWQVAVFPVNGLSSKSLALMITPIKDELPPPAIKPASGVIESSAVEMAHELTATREHLQALIEELATANEEMQSLNEESQASNEELQASNEELEAANEELQATNEELISLNGELNKKTSEMVALNNEYTHLYDAIDFPILVFDAHSILIRFNASASRRFNLRKTALKQQCHELRLPEYLNDLPDTLEQVVISGQPIDVSIKGEERHFQVSATPGIDHRGKIESLVVTIIDVTDTLQVKSRLQASENRLSTLMENTTVLMTMKDMSGRYLYANTSFLETLNLDADYKGKSDFDLFPNTFAGELWSADLESLRRGVIIEQEHTLVLNGSTRYFRCVHQVLHDSAGGSPVIINESEEITQRKNAESQLRIAARVFEHSGEAIVVTDSQSNILTINDSFTRITGFQVNEAVGRKIGRLLSSGRHSPAFYQQMWEKLTEKGYWQGEIWNKRKNGEIYPEWLSINRVNDVKDGSDDVYVAVFSDITNLKDSQRQIEFLATHDTLTQLPNRSLFQDRLNYALSQARLNNSKVALLFLDLDNFKVVNDTLGHDAGDELLVQAADRLRSIVRDVDTVARLGGDEFTIVLPDYSIAEAERFTYQILNELSIHFDIFDRKVFVSASVGAAFYPDDSDDGQGLLKAADTAMYRAKDSGRNRMQLFRSEHRVHLLKEAAIESALREALYKNELTMVYQPQFDAVDSDIIVGAEALVRWTDKTLGPVSPAEFIPVAEKTGLITELGNFVENKVLSQIMEWKNSGLIVPCISINASAFSFREKDYILLLKSKLEQHDLKASSIKIEITEGALLSNSAAQKETIEQMRTAGLEFSVDDFGTGYSSLSYLKNLPISELKVDKSFVDGLGKDSSDEEISRAILSMARALHLRTVAEGVETQDQLAWLRKEGCDVIQGYLLAKPLSPSDFKTLIKTHYQKHAGEECDAAK